MEKLITGQVQLEQYTMLQAENAISVFQEFFGRVKNVVRIVELGTHTGGFTVCLRKMAAPKTLQEYITLDVADYREYKADFEELNIDFRQGDTFNESVLRVLASEVAKPGRTVVLCDNGNKVLEFNLFATYLKPGDFIFAHDYAHSREYFETHIKNKIRNWLEIEYQDIEAAAKQNGLYPFMQPEFQKVVWACFMKA